MDAQRYSRLICIPVPVVRLVGSFVAFNRHAFNPDNVQARASLIIVFLLPQHVPQSQCFVEYALFL